MPQKTASDKDLDLFRETIGKVDAIKKDKVILRPNQKPKPFPNPKISENTNPLQNNVNSSELETLFQEDRVGYLAPGVQNNVLRKLRKGHYGLDAEIDLHGLNSAPALQALLRFITSCQENGHRSILIIHGKGHHSPDAQPVLKNDINLWLRQHQEILAFCSPPPRLGGAGALLVLLRLSEKFSLFDKELI